ncbi:MAG TPA: DUF3137 domain-containing protein [Bacteroidia bacterium]|nr:DUF3137 domain-containing protein [Bacteroidia bacterium]
MDQPLPTQVSSPEVAFSDSIAPIDAKRKLVLKRKFFFAGAALLFAGTFVLGILAGRSVPAGIAAVLLFLLGIGVVCYAYFVLPTQEEISLQFKKKCIPQLLQKHGIEGVYTASHGLSVNSFLKAGLYHHRYSHFERYDGIIGRFENHPFGLYELAVQIAGGSNGIVGLPGVLPGHRTMTNYFYGWVLHIPVKDITGRTFVIPKFERASGEADDWIETTRNHFRDNPAFEQVQSGNPVFSRYYVIYSNDASETKKILNGNRLQFLIEAATLFESIPAFSFCGGRACMHLSIVDNSFDLELATQFFPQGIEEISGRLKFFCRAINALYGPGH